MVRLSEPLDALLVVQLLSLPEVGDRPGLVDGVARPPYWLMDRKDRDACSVVSESYCAKSARRYALQLPLSLRSCRTAPK
jgi:hypothetical protein